MVLADPLGAATRIDVTGTVTTPGVKRFGMNLGVNRYYDDMLMKNLVSRNPGFEGMLYQSVVRCASGTSTGFVDENVYNVWPSGFWNDAAYEVVWGTSKGRSGTVALFTARNGSTLPSYRLPGTPTAFPPRGPPVLTKPVPAAP